MKREDSKKIIYVILSIVLVAVVIYLVFLSLQNRTNISFSSTDNIKDFLNAVTASPTNYYIIIVNNSAPISIPAAQIASTFLGINSQVLGDANTGWPYTGNNKILIEINNSLASTGTTKVFVNYSGMYIYANSYSDLIYVAEFIRGYASHEEFNSQIVTIQTNSQGGIIPTCADGSFAGECSLEDSLLGLPYYCNERGLNIVNCSFCGCRLGYQCNLDQTCTLNDKDNDGESAYDLNGNILDCNDTDPKRFHGNIEICDGIDNNCNETVDESCIPSITSETASTSSVLNSIRSKQLNDVKIVVGEVAATSDQVGAIDIASVTGVKDVILDSEEGAFEGNIISVGGPCVNSVTADLLGRKYRDDLDCAIGFNSGEGKIMLFDNPDGTYKIIIAGMSALDTKRATRVIAQNILSGNFAGYFNGVGVRTLIVKGNSLSDSNPDSISNLSSPEVTIIQFSPIEDSYISSYRIYDAYGTQNDIFVGRNTNPSSNYYGQFWQEYQAYLKFNLLSLMNKKIVLNELRISSAVNYSVDCSPIRLFNTSSSWQESSLKYSNSQIYGATAIGVSSLKKIKSGAVNEYSLDLVDSVSRALSQGNVLSLKMASYSGINTSVCPGTSSFNYYTFISKEGSNPPKLVIGYTD